MSAVLWLGSGTVGSGLIGSRTGASKGVVGSGFLGSRTGARPGVVGSGLLGSRTGGSSTPGDVGSGFTGGFPPPDVSAIEKHLREASGTIAILFSVMTLKHCTEVMVSLLFRCF
jgi:hypothetical protein